MIWRLRVLAIGAPAFFVLLLSSPLIAAEESAEEIEVVADDLQFVREEHKIVAQGNVVVVQEDLELSADQAEVNIETKEAQAEGHVILHQRGKGMISGEKASFDFRKSQGSFSDGRFFQFPWYGHSEELKQVKKKVIKAQNVYITSCDLPDPHYDLKARQATFYTGDKIVATNVTFRILKVPVFWWPYLVIPLNRSLGNITPGYSDEFGGFVLSAKGFSINENIDGRLLFDWYSKRGFGFGAEFNYEFERFGRGEVKLYGINDDSAPDDRKDNPFENKNRRDEKRGRFSWKHKMRLDPLTTLQWQWYELSDDVFLQDFFEREHRREIDPQTFATLTRNSRNYSLLAHYEKRTNRFQSVDEKLPELVFTWLRRPLFGTNFYYTNEEGFVNFNKTARFSPRTTSTMQFFTDHELSYPLSLFRYYRFIPFVNFRQDVYTKGRTKEEEVSRYVSGLGFDASTRFYRQWDYQGKWWGMEFNGVRHVLEPIIQYNSIKIASVDPSKITNTGRGDNLDHQDIVTFGIENRIQTKRKVNDDLARVDLVSFNTFLDFSFGPGSDLLDTRANKFVEGRVETLLRPYDWFLIRDNAVYSFVKKVFTSNNLDIVLEPGRWRIGIGHRLNNGGGHDDDSQLTIDLNYDVNERWDVGAYMRWEALKNTIEEWEIRVKRDLHDWMLDFGYNVRDSDRTDESKEMNREVFVELRLKAVPEIELKAGHRASFSGPRIGKTVSGVNEVPQPSPWAAASDTQHVSLIAS